MRMREAEVQVWKRQSRKMKVRAKSERWRRQIYA